jgi:outer membrane protein OmpA-like peptidoglycan-associated protein/opacity protein-like surface antigen
MKRTYAWTVALVIFGLGNAQAFDWFGGRLSIGGGYGRAKPKLPYSYQDTDQDGQMWTAHVKYYVNDLVSVVGSYADLQPQSRTTGLPIRFRPIVASVRLNLFHHLPVSPYLTAGGGLSINKKDIPNAPSIKWDKLTFQGGMGLEFFINQGTSLGAEALYHNFVAENDNVPYRLVSLVGTVNIYFGKGPSTAQAEAEAEEARQEAEKAQQEQQRLAAEKATLEQQAAEAQRKAEEEKAARTAAEQKMKEAQAAIDQIKEMVARKDLSPVMFKTGSADLLVDSHAVLDQVAAAAKKYPDLKLRVEGHTDNQGGESYNLQLSQKRAEAVRSYLVHHDGLPPDQIVAVGFGKARPIASNDTLLGRAQNRRVEFIFFIK